MDQISLFGAGIVGVLLTYLVQGAVFGLSVWICMPENKSPFRDGMGKGILDCAVFVFVLQLLMLGAVAVIPLGPIAFLVVLFVIYTLAMRWRFDASFFDALLIFFMNIGVAIAIDHFLG